MKKEYEPLFTPWKIGNVEIPNRIVQTSMGGTSLFGWLEPCHFDKEAAHHILGRAQDGVGLVLPGMQCVRDTMGRRWLYQNKKMFRDLAEWMPEFHKTGSKLFIQLAGGFGRSMAINDMFVKMLETKAFGAVSKPVVDIEYCCASAGETPNRWNPSINSRMMTIQEIQEMVEAFAKTAKLCKDAGVDGVEIHAVHEGYLLDQFTIANMNYRTDQYGGSFENRFRFPVEIVQAIKRECGQDFPVALRYSVVSKTKGWLQGAQPGEEFEEFGRDMAESEKAIKYLSDMGYDMFNCDNGTYDAWYWAHPPVYMPDNCNYEDVAHIENFTDKPVVCAGKMDIKFAAEKIKEGKIDALGIARQNLVDPDWVTKLREGREEEIKPCIRCHNACFNFAKSKHTANTQPLFDSLQLARCALTPSTMQH
ncbi:MAG: 2-enoate reductase, partial [Mogibacterium sp.]|nr:2-enoate reductase [Mogibacterium sp.]